MTLPLAPIIRNGQAFDKALCKYVSREAAEGTARALGGVAVPSPWQPGWWIVVVASKKGVTR